MKKAVSLTALLAACSSAPTQSPSTHTAPPSAVVPPSPGAVGQSLQTPPPSSSDAGGMLTLGDLLYGDYGSDAAPYDGSLVHAWSFNDSGALGCQAPDPAAIAAVAGCKQVPLPAGSYYYDPNNPDAGIFSSVGIPINRPIGTCPANAYVVRCDNAYGGPDVWVNGPPTSLGCLGMVEDLHGNNFCCPCP